MIKSVRRGDASVGAEGRRTRGRRNLSVALLTTTLAGAFTVPMTVVAHAAPDCTTSTNPPIFRTLSGSNFEIDTSANLRVNGTGDCIDWRSSSTNTLRSGVLKKADRPSGSNDNSFTMGSSENDPDPKITTGSIPPNKSDLTNFGVYTETNTTPKFLELFWTRLNSPSGTTNMDFELNQKFCDPTASPTNCANNGDKETATPVRTAGDKLITYDLSRGGTVPTISIRTWSGSAWGSPTVISGGNSPQALGSVNSAAIPAGEAAGVGTPAGAGLDPFTFGEASISFDALFPPGSSCTSFGSVYAKSRSSDSFTAELKDFIDPEKVQISNCTSLTTNATATAPIEDSITDSATLAGGNNPTGTITFRAFDAAGCAAGDQVFTSTVPVDNGNGTYTSEPFTPTAVGTYYWTAQYSGDANNSPSASACGDDNESSEIKKANASISTLLSDSSITIGGSASDTATLNNATADAGGTVTYSVYSNIACTEGQRDAGTVNVTDGTVPPSNSLDFPETGTFYWQAHYSGDAKNEEALSPCESEPLTVGKAGADVDTAQEWTPQDSVTVNATAGGTPTGDVTFKLFGPNDADCSTTPKYTETVTLDADGKAKTSNDTFVVNKANAGQYRWKVMYNGDDNHDTALSQCGVENSTLTVTDSNA
ncbi:Ig-like domain-containing protein [Streptomyces xanthii]|uniref:Ig-like domain repeat protein n=1 Tax=Streptomyces xanthii TaxID=2768069 RepID=A0A7H1B5Q0_9ACTN|nr:Ig-like domain-containing protein [Streptomyces xanthii]QNS04055.1 Ig-like domain repeat protein [Streptomyces xanthii]